MSQRRVAAGVSTGGQFAEDRKPRSLVTLDAVDDVVLGDGFNLTQAEPPAVDERLAEIYGCYYRALDAADAAGAQVKWLEGYDFRNRRRGTDEQIAEAEQVARQKYADARAVLAETAPYDAEFERRGGWTRAYLVNNVDGHIHSSMNCSTCNNGEYATRFKWLTEASGQDESQIVEDAGEKACTTCYRSAPTLPSFGRPSKYRTDDEVAADQRRAERAAAAEARRAKAIFDPQTGEPLRSWEVGTGRRGGGMYRGSVFKTERGAELAAVDGLASTLWYSDHPMQAGWQATATAVAEALAAKHGRDPKEVLAEFQAKAVARDKRDRRAAGLPPRSYDD